MFSGLSEEAKEPARRDKVLEEAVAETQRAQNRRACLIEEKNVTLVKAVLVDHQRSLTDSQNTTVFLSIMREGMI